MLITFCPFPFWIGAFFIPLVKLKTKKIMNLRMTIRTRQGKLIGQWLFPFKQLSDYTYAKKLLYPKCIIEIEEVEL